MAASTGRAEQADIANCEPVAEAAAAHADQKGVHGRNAYGIRGDLLFIGSQTSLRCVQQ
ncbi:MAG: hypothetical protein M3N82_11895 [Pseudomonadota bacterium]|nr:hypothetical protein [Pseudomonadota bacterium]